MRSRYSAYVLKLEPYLFATWHPSTRPTEPLFAIDDLTKWQSLEIKQHSIAPDGLSGMVEFVAIYKINGKAHRLHEKSRFVFENNQWYYVDGTFD
jgi:SEC-C motif-containing protein